jgi:hypothetical protein
MSKRISARVGAAVGAMKYPAAVWLAAVLVKNGSFGLLPEPAKFAGPIQARLAILLPATRIVET